MGGPEQGREGACRGLALEKGVEAARVAQLEPPATAHRPHEAGPQKSRWPLANSATSAAEERLPTTVSAALSLRAALLAPSGHRCFLHGGAPDPEEHSP